MEQNKPVRWVRWCHRCGGDLCYSKEKGVVCLECFARNEEVLYPIGGAAL